MNVFPRKNAKPFPTFRRVGDVDAVKEARNLAARLRDECAQCERQLDELQRTYREPSQRTAIERALDVLDGVNATPAPSPARELGHRLDTMQRAARDQEDVAQCAADKAARALAADAWPDVLAVVQEVGAAIGPLVDAVKRLHAIRTAFESSVEHRASGPGAPPLSLDQCDRLAKWLALVEETALSNGWKRETRAA